jgi:FemAB-related protein (PEP-CTERM system-associated)
MPTEAVVEDMAPAVAADGEVPVTVATPADRTAWDAFVSSSSSATGYHEWAWRTVIEQSFGHEAIYLMAHNEHRVLGVLPIVQIKSLLFGRTMTSLPFLNYGGVLAGSERVASALVEKAAELARERGIAHIELRHVARRFHDLPCKQHKVTMKLALQAGLWDKLDRKVRNQVRKAEKSELVSTRGGAELVGEFYAVFTRNMRDLGTPVYARRFFEEILNAFPDRAKIIVVRLKDRPIAAGLTFRTRGSVEIPWASSIRDFNSLCPNHLLYWTALEAAIADGCDTFDFGRSTPDEGTYKFKEQWGAEPVQLHWEYRLLREGGLPDQSPRNPKFRMMIETWKRCPLWLTNALGPHIVRSIP